MVAESGSNPNSGKALSFYSHYRIGRRTRQAERSSAPSIFLAEDNPADVELLRMALEEHDISCELFVTGDGEKAVSFIREIDSGVMACPRLAIIDLNLPKRSGREVLRYIRNCPVFDPVPVVILSSSGSPKDMAETAQLGANKYIRKPSSLEEFLQIGGLLKLEIDASDSSHSY
ncbi:MAG: response regulator [Bryobacteraceae bacterium]